METGWDGDDLRPGRGSDDGAAAENIQVEAGEVNKRPQRSSRGLPPRFQGYEVTPSKIMTKKKDGNGMEVEGGGGGTRTAKESAYAEVIRVADGEEVSKRPQRSSRGLPSRFKEYEVNPSKIMAKKKHGDDMDMEVEGGGGTGTIPGESAQPVEEVVSNRPQRSSRGLPSRFKEYEVCPSKITQKKKDEKEVEDVSGAGRESEPVEEVGTAAGEEEASKRPQRISRGLPSRFKEYDVTPSKIMQKKKDEMEVTVGDAPVPMPTTSPTSTAQQPRNAERTKKKNEKVEVQEVGAAAGEEEASSKRPQRGSRGLPSRFKEYDVTPSKIMQKKKDEMDVTSGDAPVPMPTTQAVPLQKRAAGTNNYEKVEADSSGNEKVEDEEVQNSRNKKKKMKEVTHATTPVPMPSSPLLPQKKGVGGPKINEKTEVEVHNSGNGNKEEKPEGQNKTVLSGRKRKKTEPDVTEKAEQEGRPKRQKKTVITDDNAAPTVPKKTGPGRRKKAINGGDGVEKTAFPDMQKTFPFKSCKIVLRLDDESEMEEGGGEVEEKKKEESSSPPFTYGWKKKGKQFTFYQKVTSAEKQKLIDEKWGGAEFKTLFEPYRDDDEDDEEEEDEEPKSPQPGTSLNLEPLRVWKSVEDGECSWESEEEDEPVVDKPKSPQPGTSRNLEPLPKLKAMVEEEGGWEESDDDEPVVDSDKPKSPEPGTSHNLKPLSEVDKSMEGEREESPVQNLAKQL